ncbi:MAG: DUF86 domain-containing protein [Defluviitaleaceae bacterium]|nr:DUF86 domain-containing protein [Defluviitaleaceae bacterium]MCL2275256.1 DUF86 domain-containing protein [Defluviitaleaceae bacterium]
MKDRIIIGKIQEYVRRVKRIYDLIVDLEEQEILALDDSFALTQFLINIDHLFSCISSDDIAQKQIEMGIRSLNTCRNISAHDYDSLDWNRVKQLCKKLISDKSEILLNECYAIAQEEETKMKDYR